jgi:enoyl-CoA hydratase/carnithine racemase
VSLIVSVADEIATVTVDNPPANVLTQAVYEDIASTFSDLGARDDVKAIILTATGSKFFSAGADINDWVELTPENSDYLFNLTGRALDAVYEVPRVVIAAVNGYALAGGMALAAVCDIVLAAESATFGLTEINVGVFGGLMHARRWFPESVIRDLAFTGRFMRSREAYERGAIHKVVEDQKLQEEALAVARMVASKSLAGISIGKSAANVTENLTITSWKREFPTYTELLFNHPEAREAARAFFQRKRG